MFLQPLTSLSWVYQLHYYLCFRTHLRRKLFAATQSADVIATLVDEICRRHEYSLLKFRAYPEHIRCLISLRPDQDIATAVKTVKADASREYSSMKSLSRPVWARGYLAQSVGRVRIEPVRIYLQLQAEHHGYARRILPPVFRYRTDKPVPLAAAHSSFDLNHHLVLVTQHRASVFGSQSGEDLCQYWLRVAAKRGFAVDQVTVLPDHVHLLLRMPPKLTVQECTLSQMNNAQHFIGRHFPEALIQAKVKQLWRPSAFAGTRGKMTTELLKRFL
jgi:putative transposase